AIQIQSPYAQEYIDGFLASCAWSDDFIRTAPLELVLLILSRDPFVITNKNLWSRPDHMSFIGRYVTDLTDANISVGEVLTAMARAGAWNAVVALGEVHGEIAFDAIF